MLLVLADGDFSRSLIGRWRFMRRRFCRHVAMIDPAGCRPLSKRVQSSRVVLRIRYSRVRRGANRNSLQEICESQLRQGLRN